MTALRSLHSRRGSSFIEILVSLALLAVVMVGILQMFTLSLLTNFGSAARTDLLYKAQQVVENLRLIYYLQNPEGEGNDAVRAASGVPVKLAATASPIYLPYNSQGADPANPAADDPDTDLTWSHWGPRGFNIVEAEKLPYRLSYTVEARGPNNWLVTVTAVPVDNPDVVPPVAVTDALNPHRFLGSGSKRKIVTYSAMIEN